MIMQGGGHGQNKNQSGLFHFLSGAKAAPGVGQLEKGRISYIFGVFNRFSAPARQDIRHPAPKLSGQAATNPL